MTTVIAPRSARQKFVEGGLAASCVAVGIFLGVVFSSAVEKDREAKQPKLALCAETRTPVPGDATKYDVKVNCPLPPGGKAYKLYIVEEP